ncbi:MAG: transposase [Lachnospiraceae bacterium]|nr:transposase [Lachnospiraceae bacterium]
MSVSGALYKTVNQYNKVPVSEADMKRLEELAHDYRFIKNYVYQRYGGIQSLPKLYPGYTIQNEMTASGLRKQLGLPSVYFYCAVFDALGDIKGQWSQTKARVEKNIRENENLTPEDRHYLRFVMKQSQCLEAVLLEKEPMLSMNWQQTYEEVRAQVRDESRLRRYLCRQVRRHLKKLYTEAAEGFSVTQKGYRYGDHGIYLSVKENRKRVFIPLTDSNCYSRQLYVHLEPEKGNVKIAVPVEQKIRQYAEYQNEVGLAVGMRFLFVTDQGHIYGERYGLHQEALIAYLRKGQISYHRNKQNNPGRKKYLAGKARLEAALHTYINAEINRMIHTEKPKVLYIPRLPPSSGAGINKKINQAASLWQRGYVRRRLEQKCREHAIQLVEVFAKGISCECSSCGETGIKAEEEFRCHACGLSIPERENTARNVLRRGKKMCS